MHITLEKLQNKSEAQKTMIAFGAAGVVTLFLFVVWGYNFAYSGKVNNLANSIISVSSVVENIKTKEGITTTLSQMKNMQQALQKQITQQGETPPAQGEGNLKNSISKTYMNVFASPETQLNSEQRYGENSADILY